ncbi:MAG: autotransporter-associated beta strand repeat-containing protein [Sutterella sp.]|nr:autotransporter-associated beta strand repeat-containing protein [Sutterella sp.]
MAKVTTDVQSGGVLTITNLTLAASQTLKLTGGDLTFAGTTNLDQGTKTFTSGTYRFADQAVLETALGSLSAVLGNNPSAMLDSPNATLRTKGPTFTSSADVAKFGTWEVQSGSREKPSTATGSEQLAKVTTDVQSGGVLTITALTLGASQVLKLTGGDLTFAGLTNLDEGTKAFDSGKYGFADQAVLETTKASLTEVLGNVDTMELSSGATLRTKGGSFTSSADVTKFGTWEVQGAATTATGAEQLSKTTDVQSGGDLTVTDLTLVAGKTLKNTGGTLTFAGTTNVDEGTLVLQSGTSALASGATLVTNQPNADAIQSGAVRSLANREEATLQTDSTFESTGGFAGSFGNWLVNANAKTDSLALYGSELAENVQLDATAMNFIDRVVATNTGSALTLNDARVVQGAVTGSGSLVKTGSGTLVLEKGNHRYTGTTEVQSGTLVLEKGANLAGDLTMASGSTLELSLLETNREAASRARRLRRALAEETAPSANHTVAGAATLANTAITVASPTEYSQLAAESITIANGATLTIDARDFKGGTDRLENVLKATSDFTGEYASFSDNSLVFVLTPEYDPANHAMHLAVRPDTGAPEV